MCWNGASGRWCSTGPAATASSRLAPRSRKSARTARAWLLASIRRRWQTACIQSRPVLTAFPSAKGAAWPRWSPRSQARGRGPSRFGSWYRLKVHPSIPNGVLHPSPKTTSSRVSALSHRGAARAKTDAAVQTALERGAKRSSEELRISVKRFAVGEETGGLPGAPRETIGATQRLRTHRAHGTRPPSLPENGRAGGCFRTRRVANSSRLGEAWMD